MFDKKSDLINPIAHVVQYVDPRTDQNFTKDLREAQARQKERDMIHEAFIDNLFHGQPYLSIFDEFPGLREFLTGKKKP